MADPGRNEERRQPRNLQGLLNFCTEITAREDNTEPRSLEDMEPERLAFLQEALAGMTTNISRVLAEALKLLYSEVVLMPEEDVSDQEDAMETLEEYLHDLNYAADFYKMGGFPALLRCLDSPHACLRAGACGLIGDLCQNNLFCQENMLALQAMTQLLSVMDCDADTQARVKALYAISCMIRDYPPGEQRFLESDGLSYLMRAMQSGSQKLLVKSTFLLNNLVRNNEKYIDAVISMGYIEQLAVILTNECTDDTSREHCTSALYGLASTYPQALRETLRPELKVPHTLRTRLVVVKGKEEFLDEENHIKDMLSLIEGEAEEDENR